MAEAFDALHQRPDAAAGAAGSFLRHRAHRAGRARHQAHGPGHAGPEIGRLRISGPERTVRSALDGLDAIDAHFQIKFLGNQDGFARRVHGADLASSGALHLTVLKPTVAQL